MFIAQFFFPDVYPVVPAVPFFPCPIKMSSLLNTRVFHVFGSISVLFILFYCLTVCSHISILII